MSCAPTGIAVLIVGFRNAQDISHCLRALADAESDPGFSVYISENGGPAAFDSLVAELTAEGGPCTADREPGQALTPKEAKRAVRLNLVNGAGVERTLTVAEMNGNLGYAGGLNAWFRALMATPEFQAAWILNPDTAPKPDALREMAAYAQVHHKGLIGSRLVFMAEPDFIQTRGLKWRKIRACPGAIDRMASATTEVESADIERLIDAPGGASVYVTRETIDRIGLMDEDFFLYYEDLEWGLRARDIHAIGYAHKAVVAHMGGTTIGGSSKRAARSKLSVYLDARNRIRFVRKRYPGWLAWTSLVVLMEALAFTPLGASASTVVALRGLKAGLAGEKGMPAASIFH